MRHVILPRELGVLLRLLLCRPPVWIECLELGLELGLGWVEAWDISEQRIPRSFHLRPFIVLVRVRVRVRVR